MTVLHFIAEHYDTIALIVAAIASLVYLIARGEKGIIEQIAFRLVTEAEKQFGGGTGILKKAAVISWLYSELPSFIKMFVTEKMLSSCVEKVLEAAKQKWDSNDKLKEYITTPIDTNIK